MGLRGARLRRPARVLGRRRLARGFLVTAGELAALAHLPYEPWRVPGLHAAGARPVPPPAGVLLAGPDGQFGPDDWGDGWDGTGDERDGDDG
jgi:hypothetical protein